MIRKEHRTYFALSLLGYFCYVSLDSTFKYLGTELPLFQLLFLNAIISSIPIFFYVLKKSGKNFYKRQHFPFLIIRGLLQATAFLFVLGGIIKTPMALVYPTLFSSPMILLVLSSIFLPNENLNRVRIIAVILGFIGVFVSANPLSNADGFISRGVIEIFIGASCIAVMNLITRKYSHLASIEDMALSSNLISAIIYGVICFFVISFEPMNFHQITISFCGAFFTVFAIMLVVAGSKNLPTPIFGVTHYSQLFYGALLGYVIFREVPNLMNIIGIGIIITAGAILYFLDKPRI